MREIDDSDIAVDTEGQTINGYELDDVFEAVLTHLQGQDNEGTIEFIESLMEQYEEGKELTENQLIALGKFYIRVPV